MGLEKAGINIGKNIIAWTRTSNRSLFVSKPIKINVSELKYNPDMVDTFVSTNKARQASTETIGLLAGKQTLTKEQEIEMLRNQLEQAELDFIETNKNNIPSYEERYNEVLYSIRRNYGCSDDNIFLAERIAPKENRYLSFAFEKTDIAKKLQLQLNLKLMNSNELELYQKAINMLNSKHLPYDELEVSEFPPFVLKMLSEGLAVNGHVAGHGYAYNVNGVLRMGANIDDTIRVVLDEGFKTVKPLEKSETVYREVVGNKKDKSLDFINWLISAKKGDTFVDKGYSYASYAKNCAQACNSSQDLGTPFVKMRIIVPEGAKVSDGRMYEQYEMLLPRNAEYRVVEEAKIIHPGKIYMSNGEERKTSDYMEMTVEYVLPENLIKELKATKLANEEDAFWLNVLGNSI